MTAASETGTMMLTVFLRHDQSQNMEQLQGKLDDSDWWHGFPPEDCEIVSWVVAMGIGQIVTLRLPADKLNRVNVELERRAWGVFSTEFYPTYDFLPVRERLIQESDERRGGAMTRAEAPGVPGPPRERMFSNARVHDGHFFLSGMHAGSPEGVVGGDDAYLQAQEVFRRLAALAEACGGRLDDLITLRVYLTDMADKAAVGRARAEAFSGDFPCSILVEVSALVDEGLRVEIEAQGILGSATDR